MNQPAALAYPVLQAAGIQAGHIAHLWWVFLVVLSAVYLAVLVALVASIARRRGAAVEGAGEQGPARAVAVSVGLTVLILLGLFGGSVATGRALGTLGEVAGEPLSIKVIGHRWWWELQYQNHDVSQMVTTANELHLPVGQPVQLTLESRDVIHSFWVPALHGKRDLIPGYQNVIAVRADAPGVFAGRCAEFCGAQHANMGLTVVAEPPDAFAAWLAAQRAPAAQPPTAAAARGRDVFLRSACPLCHHLGGTRAFGMLGPDLTHFGSRRALAAGALVNDAGPLEAWLGDPQTIKPGNHMPIVALRPEDRRDLVAYLEALK
ncbi:MAG TPA: cytochrome c oxidase subunit II [Polyangia bacterium]|nr:cytochrome c oxidase subunit II [Polyangia bacterium]